VSLDKPGTPARGLLDPDQTIAPWTAQACNMDYFCPMHSAVRQAAPGKCPKCGMDLLPEGTRFAMLKHMAGKPWHLAGMIALMIVLMALAMMAR
jgi:hypothetical protein